MSKISRRAALARGGKDVSADATSGRILSIPVLHSTPAGHSTLAVEDSCFAPLILEGDTVVIDPGQTRLVSGELYAIKREGKTQIWLPDEASASLPGDYKTEVWLLTLNDPFRWVGPCDRQEVKTIGRVVGLLDKDRPLAPEGDSVLVHPNGSGCGAVLSNWRSSAGDWRKTCPSVFRRKPCSSCRLVSARSDMQNANRKPKKSGCLIMSDGRRRSPRD